MAVTTHGTFKRLDEGADKWAKRVVKTARGNLTRERSNSSKSLWKSIRYKITAKDGKTIVTFFMEKYGAFLDKGVSGTGQLKYRGGKSMPVAYNKSDAGYSFKSGKTAIGGNLKQWLSNKGLSQSLDFVIRRSVHARGIRPRRFFSDAFKDLTPEFDSITEEAATAAIEEQLDNILKPLNT
jgi:hypothetical protein